MSGRIARALVVGLVVLGAAPRAYAGPDGETLGNCLVDSTTTAEKRALVRWIFAMAALHPGVQDGSTVTNEQRTAMSKDAARLIERLLTEACFAEARAAIQSEGQAAIRSSFQMLGQVAAQELFSHPKVAEGLAEVGKYVDEEKFEKLVPKKK
ncbi:MAG TPA: hypothetical protein VEB43_05685 [Anaeromyxobacter sp.]|nr:hypothetical protein [Anaeromyxobacter sp.]